jgi:LuxR family transcriptional regulator
MEISNKSFLKACRDMVSSKTVSAAWNNYKEVLTFIGFDRHIFLSTHYRTYGLWGDPRDTLVLSSHEKKYNNALFSTELNFLKHHPDFEWLVNNPGDYMPWHQFSQDDVSNNSFKKKLKILNDQFKVRSGIKFSLKQSNHESTCVVLLTGCKQYDQTHIDNIWATNSAKIYSISKILQLTIRSLPYTGGGIGPKHQRLTKRQAEVLTLISSGNTVIQVAQKLNLAVTTIDKHLKLARSGLSVNSTAQAVAKAEREKMLR